MIKNTAGQKIGAQMVSAADGSAFTGSVTVAVTGDAGTQATGSVGAGACAHEGNGYHTYAPAQAETNYDLVAFTFTGTGAIPASMQVYPITGDAFARLGAPAGASVSADMAAVKADTAAILIDTGTTLDARIPAALVSGRMDSSVGAMAANVLTAAAAASDLTTEFQSGLATQSSVDDLPTNAELATALGTADDAVLAAIAALNNLSQANIRTALGMSSANLDSQLAALFTTALTESYAADGVAPTVAQALFLIQQRLTEFVIASTTVTVKKLDGSTTAATLTLDSATAPTSSTRAT